MYLSQMQDGIALTLKTIQLNDFRMIDDHTGKPVTLGGAGIYQRDGKQTVVALFTKEFSDYYCINEVVIKEDGLLHLTRNNCGGTIFNATMDIASDVRRMEAGFCQETIKKYPALAPGQITNITTPTDA